MSIGIKIRQKKNLLFHKRFYPTLCKVAETMKSGFTNSEFYTAYATYYPYMIQEVEELCKDNLRYNKNRVKNGHKPVAFPKTVQDYIQKESYHLLKSIRQKHLCGKCLSDIELQEKLQRLKLKSEKKIEQRKGKDEYYFRCAQDVCPVYIDDLIKTYFEVRRNNTLDVNSRYLILLEAAQFRCEKTRAFLNKVSYCDKNNDLRLQAFFILQRMGYNPWLPKKRKGKQHLSSLKEIDITKNPTILLDYIYKYQATIHKRFDIFLSHSYSDTDELFRLKQMLNAQGFVVYIDWVNDKVMLNRNNQNEDTWTVLKARMDVSDKMIFVMTNNSLRSEWTPKEIDYFQKQEKQIYVLQLGEISEKVFEGIERCLTCEIENNKIRFNQQGKN